MLSAGLWFSCTENPEEQTWHHAEFIVIDKKGFEHRTARIEEATLLKKLNRLAVGNRPAYLCPVNRIIRLVSQDGDIYSLPISLCPGNEHVYTRHERTWAAWRIDPRLLPLLDSLFSSPTPK